MAYNSHRKRSLAKTATWRAIALVSDFFIIYVFIKKFFPSLGIFFTAVGLTLTSNTISTIAYYLHERMWNKIKWGKEALEKI